MIDDLLSISSCGMKSIEMNISINTLIDLKKLTFHTPEANKKSKCHVMHIGKANKSCPEMKIHGVAVERVSQAVYLGDVLSEDGSNTSNIKDRVSKGMGQMNTILTLLKTVSFGSRYFQIAVTLREAHLINGMLSSSDVWYGVKKKETDALEEVDKIPVSKPQSVKKRNYKEFNVGSFLSEIHNSGINTIVTGAKTIDAAAEAFENIF